MTQTKWSHLPNAKHIDWVLNSLKAYSGKWDASWVPIKTTVREAAYVATVQKGNDAIWHAVWDETFYQVSIYHAAKYAAMNSVAALIAWDDCGYMIGSEVGELKIIAKLGDQKAILLLPACIVFNQTKELV